MNLRHRGLGLFGLLALFALALSGCATAPAPIAQTQTLTGQEGAVVFKFITNGSSTFDPAETLSSITLKRDVAPGTAATGEDTAILSRTREMTHSTAVFSGKVAPGRYRIAHASGFSGNTTYTFPLSGFGSFEVKTGAVSLLGTLLVQPLAGTRFAVGYVPPEAELNQTFVSLFPALAEQTKGQTPLSLEPSAELARRTLMTPLFKQMTTVFNGVQARRDGTVLAGSKMGRVLWRKAGERNWRRLQIDTWKEVLSVRPYRDGLLAAGEEGLLRYSADEGKSWQVLTPPQPGLIALAEPLPNGKVLALVRRHRSWTAFLSDDPLAGGWRSVGTFEQEQSLNVPWQNALVLSSGNRAGVLMPNGEYRVVDGDSGSLERRSLGVSIFGAQAQPDGLLVVRGGTMTTGTLVSSDGGRQWTDLDTHRFVGALAFASASKAFAIAPETYNIFPGPYALMVSEDRAKTWKKAGELPGSAPNETRFLLVDPTDGALLAFMQNGQILRSADEGKTWVKAL